MVKCYQCKENVDKSIAVKVDTTKPDAKKQTNRYFHNECHEAYKEKMKDWKDWDELYQYIKHEILKYDKIMKLSKHFVSRLQGLRSGTYGVMRNKNVLLSEDGYSYKTILTTFKIKKAEIMRALADNSKFKDEKHKVDYIMVIIQDSINDVHLRIKEKNDSDKRIKEISFSDNIEVEFKNRSNLKGNKVANKLKHLW